MTSVEALIQAAVEFVVNALDLAAEPAAAAAAQQSLDDSGLLLLGEMHGARENPLLARALMQAFRIAMRRWPGACWPLPPAGTRTLAVAGNAHTPTSPIELGIPMGAWLHRQRPGVREIRINYGSGRYYNSQPCRFAHHGLPPHQIRLRQQHGLLVLDLPTAQEAIVPHRFER